MWLLLANNISNSFEFDKKYTYLLDLKKINIIVGKNNSGKSYLMRRILNDCIKVLTRDEIREMIFNEKNFENSSKLYIFDKIESLSEINNKYLSILKQIDKFNQQKVASSRRVIGGIHPGVVYDFLEFQTLKNESRELINYLGITNPSPSDFSDKVVYEKDQLITNAIKEYKDKICEMFDQIKDDEIFAFGEVLHDFGYVEQLKNQFMSEFIGKENKDISQTFKNYIPLIRSIRHPLKSPGKRDESDLTDIYKKRISEEYNYDERQINIITGLDFYSEYKKKLLGSKAERKVVNKFEKFLSNYFFEGKELSIIPDEKTYELKVNIEDSQDKFIYQVGDGITSLLIIMYNIFLNSDFENNIYFIEEPEQSFHPGFQRLFMNMISLHDVFKNCYFFFTTHSNHIIDIGNYEFKNIQNFLCTKGEEKINVKVQDKDDISIIQELGVKPSSVQLANKIIWVEGKYDASYIRLLLNVKNMNNNSRKYIEGYDYVFVPYGGSNGVLINFSFENEEEINNEFILKAERINHDFLLIMDDDGISKNNCSRKKKNRYTKLKRQLNNRLYKLEAREIENIFPTDIIKQYFKQGVIDYQNCDFIETIDYEKYRYEKLGGFLNKLIKNNIGEDLKKITGRENGFEKSGFLYDKSKFYECVQNWVMSESFDYDTDATQAMKNLIEKIEEFIKK